ncbi:hypothetical protein OUZ56_022671 [Daphnia magna]|uniref:Uncharacterized protein n=1 Tax=Daphnia magna TaxID=35525 RepID=A0ABR0AX63_9CRUS|nr:hypothetical protein OUZ56_022671 [Daphnia magna]
MEVVGYERNLAPHQPLLTSFPPSGKSSVMKSPTSDPMDEPVAAAHTYARRFFTKTLAGRHL